MRKFLLCLIFLFIPFIVFSQEDDENSVEEKIDLKGKHSIFLNLGMIKQTTSITIDPLNVSNNMNFQASLCYNYWVRNDIAIEASIGYINSSVNNNISIYGIEQKTAVVTNFYFGLKYCPVFKSFPSTVRPFTKLLIGEVVGSTTEEKVSYGLVKSNYSSQYAFSVKPGIGIDLIMDKYLRFGLGIDYLYMPDFKESVGTRKNYSGVNFSFIFGALF